MTDPVPPDATGELVALMAAFAAEQEALTELVTELTGFVAALQARLDALETAPGVRDPEELAEEAAAMRAEAAQARRQADAVRSEARTIQARSRELADMGS